MNEDHLSISRLVMIGAGVVALTLGVWWYVATVPDQDAPRRDPQAGPGTSVILAPQTLATPVGAEPILPSTGSSSAAAGTAASTTAVAPRPETPPGDLLAAIKRAQAAAGTQAIAPPVGQSSWQGMSPKEAAKAFEEAVKAASASSAVSPFSKEKAKN